MTFLNSAANLGFRWTNSLAIWAVGFAALGTIDGYTIITVICVIFGIAWMYFLFPTLKRLETVPRTAWWVSSNNKTNTGKGKQMQNM